MKGSGRSSKNLKDSQSHTWLNEERRWSAGKKKQSVVGFFFCRVKICMLKFALRKDQLKYSSECI